MFYIKERRRLKEALELKKFRIAMLEEERVVLLGALQDTQIRLAGAQMKINNPPVYKENEKIGPFRILEIKYAEVLNFEAMAAAACAITFGISVLFARIFKKPFSFPEFPQKKGWLYRFYDEEVGQERELHEFAFKQMVQAKITS